MAVWTFYYFHAEIIGQPSNATVCVGENATFTCTVTRPRKEISDVRWQILRRKFGFVSFSGRRYDFPKNYSSNQDRLTQNLIIINVTTSDNGTQYQCNPTENASSNIVLLTVAGMHCITCIMFHLNYALVCNSYTMAMRDLSDIYALAQGWPEG